MCPEIPSSLLDDLVRNGVDTRSNPRHISENNPLDDADGNATATAAAEPTTTSDGALLGLCGDQLNNDFISRKTALRPVASCSPRPPDVPGAYNINSSSGCFRPGSFRPGATFFRLDAPGAPWRSLPSNHTPRAKPLPPAAPEAPVRLPPPSEAFRP